MTKEARIKCTGEKLLLKHLGDGYYLEITSIKERNPLKRYGRRFHYSELNFEKKI